VTCGIHPRCRHSRPGYAKASPGLAVSGRRSVSEGGRREPPGFQRQQFPMRGCGVLDRPVGARSEPGDDTGIGEAARKQPQSIGSPRLPRGGAAMAARLRRGQISNVGDKECRQYPGFRRTRASANTSGPDFTMARRPLVKLRSPFFGEPHRTKKTRFFCRTVKANDPTVDLMSRRHPLSSIRTSRRR
jgi:hypothetical protein